MLQINESWVVFQTREREPLSLLLVTRIFNGLHSRMNGCSFLKSYIRRLQKTNFHIKFRVFKTSPIGQGSLKN